MANLDLMPFAGYISDDSDFLGMLTSLHHFNHVCL
jgi:hypothetical protein